jgi:YVTN family beta-propeller protein
MLIQLFDRIKNKWSILLVLFVLMSMTANAASAPSSVQTDTGLPIMQGGEFVNPQPASPLQGPSWLEYRPPSNIEKPGDIGHVSHTNLRKLIPPNGTTISPVSHAQAVQNFRNLSGNKGSNAPMILSGETPSSFACVYNLTTQPTTQPIGCKPSITTVNPVGGAGAIAIVDAYDTPTAATDLAYFSTYFGLPAATFNVIYAGGAWPYITGPKPPASSLYQNWNAEEALDTQWAHAMAPNAKIFLVEAQSSSFADQFTAVPALTIQKSASPTNYSKIGQNITYTYNVTNIGNLNLTGNITVTDNRTGTFNITSSGLNVGKNVTHKSSYTITQADLDAGSVTNLANATNNNITSNTVNATIASSLVPYAYITNYLSNNVSVINTTTNNVTATMPVGIGPTGVAVSPDGTKVYVANEVSNNVSVIDTATNQVTATVPVGNYPDGVAVSPDGQNVYVANQNDNTVSVINTTTNKVTATVPVGTGPFGVAVTPDGSNAYLTNFYGNTVSVINTTNNTVTATVNGLNMPNGVSVTPDGQKVYVTNYASNNVSVINTSTNAVTATVPVGAYPQGVSVTLDGKKVYVANGGNNNVSVIDTTTNDVTATVNVGNYPIAFGQFIAVVSNKQDLTI